MDKQPPTRHNWVEAVRLRGWTGAARMLLDVLEPVGPLGAQVLWVFQPLSGVFGWQRAVAEIARALEQPGGVETLRRQLEPEDSDQSN